MFAKMTRRDRIVRYSFMLSIVAGLAGLYCLNGCASSTATATDRAEIVAALREYQAARGAKIIDAAQVDLTVRGTTANARYAITFPHGQIAYSTQRAYLVKGADGWVVEDVEPKRIWK